MVRVSPDDDVFEIIDDTLPDSVWKPVQGPTAVGPPKRRPKFVNRDPPKYETRKLTKQQKQDAKRILLHERMVEAGINDADWNTAWKMIKERDPEPKYELDFTHLDKTGKPVRRRVNGKGPRAALLGAAANALNSIPLPLGSGVVAQPGVPNAATNVARGYMPLNTGFPPKPG